MAEWWAELEQIFYISFIYDNRWKYIVDGIGITLIVTFFALILGITLGFIVSMIRSTHDKTGKFKIANAVCQLYLTVIRGTPIVVQLMIFYFAIFTSRDANPVFVAVLAFGINSGAYVAEIFRSGIISIESGQFEAGRSLGFNYSNTMWHVIMPQALRNIIPALGNEFIVLLKETAVCGYIGLQDLTKGADIIRGTSFQNFMPLIAAALIYLFFVILISMGLRRLERRLNRRAH